jgi:hypothetical protein
MEALIKEQFVRLLRYAYPGFLAFFYYAYRLSRASVSRFAKWDYRPTFWFCRSAK